MKPQGKWHRENTLLDQMCERHKCKANEVDLNGLYQHHIKECGGHRIKVALTLVQYLFVKFNRPRWYISKEMFDLLSDVAVDTLDLSGIFIPHDSMIFCFERGIILPQSYEYYGGRELCSIMFSNPRSMASERFLGEILSISSAKNFVGDMFVGSACMLNSSDAEYNTEVSLDFVRERKISLYDAENCALETAEKGSKELNNFVVKLIVASFLYHAARPEFFVQTILDSESRKSQSTPRENMYKILTPEVKLVRQGQSNHTGGTKRPHWRGWVLRTLRNDRYKRKSDGTYNVILVPPCAIHGEKENSEQVLGKQA